MPVGRGMFGRYVQNNFRILLVSFLFLTLGIAAGSLYCASLPQTANDALYGVFSGYRGMLREPNSLRIFAASFWNYFQLWVLLWLCGTCRLGVPVAPVLVGLRGFVCGFSVSALFMLYAWNGLAAAAAGILPPMLLVFPALQMYCVGAVNQARAGFAIPDRALARSRFVTYCVFSLFVLAAFTLAALYEGYAGWIFILKLLA